ncbi:MAG: hypothetical protein AAFY72_16590 [Cyanobacteria bacterium J06649_4]
MRNTEPSSFDYGYFFPSTTNLPMGELGTRFANRSKRAHHTAENQDLTQSNALD